MNERLTISLSARVEGGWFFSINQSPLLTDVFTAAFKPGLSNGLLGHNRTRTFQLLEKI
jgi:hypothetical protein